MTQFIKKLPSVFQTTTEKKFFDSTFDQLFSKKDSDLLYGYLGRRNPGFYNPIKDFYLPEPDKNRTWWQLEATAFARDENSNKTNIFFYNDLLNKINYYGGNTLNQDRLFESQYYSWAPPIDYDMFVNYQNYYWIEQGLPVINITGVLASSITGQTSYVTPLSANPPGITLTTGLKILLLDDPNPGPYTVENVGYQNCDNSGIRLVPQFSDVTAGAIYEFLPWDGTLTLSNGRIIHNEFWDRQSWETETQPIAGDYITIERGSLDRNAWSRTNKWFHIDTINQSVAITGVPLPVNATRALRPIIQFTADLQLFASGIQFKSNIQYGINDNLFGIPILLSSVQGQSTIAINSILGVSVVTDDLFIFFADTPNKQIIYQATIDGFGIVTFTPVGTPVIEGDIVFATEDAPFNGSKLGQTWYFSLGKWQEVRNDKVSVNQSPLFQLFDHSGIPLDDPITYPNSNFAGNTVFSYKVNTIPGATVDPVLGFPITYTSLGQASDIVFQNNVFVNRYSYGSTGLPIDGYYYYKTCEDNSVLYNNWNLYSPTAPTEGACSTFPVTASSKQRITDKYVVGFGTEHQFKLSVIPWGYSHGCPDLVVSVNGKEIKQFPAQADGYYFVTINSDIYVNLSVYLTNLLLTTQGQPPVVEIDIYTHGLLDPASTGYSQIPQQLEANPMNEEITEISASNLSQQFASIIQNQVGFIGVAFGGINNYRDSLKNRTLGQYILQNEASLLKTMLISSTDDLDFIPSIRFSADEYTKFKNKFLNRALQLINRNFDPIQYHNGTIDTSMWIFQILTDITTSKEFSGAFLYSNMFASGNRFSIEDYVIPAGPHTQTLVNFVDLNDPKNTLYIRVMNSEQTVLTVDVDYTVTSTNLLIDVTTNLTTPTRLLFTLYKDPPPNFVASTPTKVGTYPASIPGLVPDFSYATTLAGDPVWVIIGHDGSKSVAYGNYTPGPNYLFDYRDILLLGLEIRIYNKLETKFRNQYDISLRVEDIKTGHFRTTRYSRQEYLDITESYLNKWSAKNHANYRTNEWPSFSQNTPSTEYWKLYNYSDAIVGLTVPPNMPAYFLPGNWKGIYQYYYDTVSPDIRPWEMLGFSEQPDWWVLEYGAPVINANGQFAWTSSSTGLHNMWSDLENGYIRRGPCAVYNPIDNSIVSNPKWARPGLSLIIPVDISGNVRTILSIFDILWTFNPAAPFDGFDKDWVYGDGGPVEQAWITSSVYTFNVQEFLYLMKPGPFGELFWDPSGTENSPGLFIHPTAGLVNSSINWQYVQNDVYTSLDSNFAWQRPKNQDQFVHGEIIDNVAIVRFGYQRWISDRILYLNKDVTSTFGQKIRTLGINLANQLAGFTNKATTSTYIESVSPGATTTNLLIPTNNFEVVLHQGQPIATYSYSGIVIRALADGSFAVYGYDLLNSQFTVFDRSNAELIDITVGGTPSPFHIYELGATYNIGDIVRYNAVYYSSKIVQIAGVFNSANWIKLKNLPISGGVSVTYKPASLETTTRIPYGSILKSPQEVFDLMIGWGEYLKSQGWQFEDVDPQTNQLSNWLYSAKQFLFWLNTDWAINASIQLSPLANSATVIVAKGYPTDVESITNGVYNILDKFGVAISPDNTTTDRDGKTITVAPADLTSGGIYFLSVHATETEHILIFDNTTSFNDIIYAPLLRARQSRLRFNGFRTNGWYGKQEAPGYLIIGNQLVPNYDSIVDAMRYYYDPNVTIDNTSLEDLGRHLIGFESKSYLDNLLVSNNTQYLFYRGAIRQKGTKQAFEKLFRSTKVQSNEIIQVFEEWALKLNNFGNTIEQVSTEFKLLPEQNTGEVIVARLNYVPSKVGHIREIRILNAQAIYTTVPAIVIPAPDALLTDPNVTKPLRQARAFAVLGPNGIISRIDITDPGYGYLSAPEIQISSTDLSNLDKLYSVWQGDIIKDAALDNIVDIDIDDIAVWTRRPADPQHSLQFPTTPNIFYPIPNAGYVNFNDVKWSSFDVIQTVSTWGTTAFNPKNADTVWVAKGFDEDWNVFKMVKPSFAFTITADLAGNLFLEIPLTDAISTDFGFEVALQLQDPVSGIVDPATNLIVSVTPVTPPVIFTAVQYNIIALDGTPITVTNIPNYADYNTASGVLLEFKTMRFLTIPMSFPTYIAAYEYFWVDDVSGKWTVFKTSATPSVYSPYRIQEELIDSSLFENAQVFETTTQNELVLLPVYDPFKDILPGPAKQNLTYISFQDPARYNVTGNTRLFSENIIFAQNQVGQLWWDLSDIRYVYYEQPIALDGSETAMQNLVYRRNRWAQIFPGSTIDVYEWVQSLVTPDQYTGTGTPKDVTSYVQVEIFNRFTNIAQTYYYFWVKGITQKPNLENRTLAAPDVARLLQSPKSQGFTFFAPIQQTSTNNAYMFYNVQEILAFKGDNVQIQYRIGKRDDQPHAQWAFFREGDPISAVTDQFWNKMVDSLCGYTKLLPVSSEWANSIIIAKDLPWDIFGWDIAAYDTATSTTTPIYGEILPVPDPTLSESEKYGITYRPRQGMFVDLFAARKIFVQAGNDLLKHIPIRDNDPSWNTGVSTDIYWTYQTWYAPGFENVVVDLTFIDLSAAVIPLAAGQLTVGQIIRVDNGTPDGRFVLYEVVQLNPNVPVLSFEEIGIEKSAILLLDTIFTTKNIYGLSTELRELLNAFRTTVFVNSNFVGQNGLFFSMMNYVLSEQKNPNWVFKSSYIYIKENNLPLSQDPLFIPNQIDNIIAYIDDVKPYHTQIRDYFSTYQTTDIAPGAAADIINQKITLTFGPNATLGNPLSHYIVNGGTLADGLQQFISQEQVYTVPVTFHDIAKIGYSHLFPYTVSFNGLNLNNPQTFISPENIVGVTIGTNVLISEQDFFVVFNNDPPDDTYTIYFYNDPYGALINPQGLTPQALVWFDGGPLQTLQLDSYRNELGLGFSADDLVVNIDTKLPVDISTGIPRPYVGYGDVWDVIGNPIAQILVDAGGSPEIPWDITPVSSLFPNTISFKENTNADDTTFYRNAFMASGIVVNDILAPGAAPDGTPEWLDVITIFVDSSTHVDTNILPDVTDAEPGVIWVGGERIEYKEKILTTTDTWELRLVRRGTNGTAPQAHAAGATAFVEQFQQLINQANQEAWDTITLGTDAVPIGGLWYATTPEAVFLKQVQGKAVP